MSGHALKFGRILHIFVTILHNNSHNAQYSLHLDTSQQFSSIVLHNTSTTVHYIWYFQLLLLNTSQYLTIPYDSSPQKVFTLASPQCPLYNNTFVHLVLSNNANYIHQYNLNDQWLNNAASTDSHKQLLRLLSGFFYHSINRPKSYFNDSVINQESLIKHLPRIFTFTASKTKRQFTICSVVTHTCYCLEPRVGQSAYVLLLVLTRLALFPGLDGLGSQRPIPLVLIKNKPPIRPRVPCGWQ